MVNHWDINEKSIKGSSYVAFAAGQLAIYVPILQTTSRTRAALSGTAYLVKKRSPREAYA